MLCKYLGPSLRSLKLPCFCTSQGSHSDLRILLVSSKAMGKGLIDTLKSSLRAYYYCCLLLLFVMQHDELDDGFISKETAIRVLS